MSSPNPLWFLYDHNSATLKYKCVMFISASSSTLHLIVYYLLMRPVIQPAATGIHTSVLHLIVHPCFCFHYKLNLGARQVLWCHTSIKNVFFESPSVIFVTSSLPTEYRLTDSTVCPLFDFTHYSKAQCKIAPLSFCISQS